MAVYDISGNSINGAYDVDSLFLSTIYDIDGNVIESEEKPPYSIDNVVSYFRESTQSVGTEINALNSNWKSIVFVTDPHGSANQQHSQAIALWLMANTKASFIVLNGDYSDNNWSKSQYDNWVSPFLNSPYIEQTYATIGNHELFGGDSAKAESKASVYSDFLSEKANLNGNLNDVYYYFDDTSKKIRYMFINTSDSATTTMSQTQIDWITSNVQLPSQEWSLAVFGHVNIHSMGFTYLNETNGSSIINAINTCNGNIIGYFCGHQHIGGIYDVGGFYQAMLYCDRLETNNYYQGYSITDRSAGNTTEQAVSVISFNTKTGDVVIRRIGVGLNRTLFFNYLQ